jgi:hypothetical protein
MVEIRPFPCEPRGFDAKRPKDEALQGGTEVLAGQNLDHLPDDQIADIRVLPPGADGIAESIAVEPLEKGGYWPGIIASLDRLVIGQKQAIVHEAGSVLQKVAQAVGPVPDGLVQGDKTVAHERQRRGRQNRLRKTPPGRDEVSVMGLRHVPVLD